MIGLIDCEALRMREPFIPNLEIMKLYSYYKKNQLTKLILSPEILDAYSQIYLRREFDTTAIPKEWTVNRPVKWGGLSFTNNNHYPMVPEIERALPNYHVYNEYIRTMLSGRPKILADAEKFLNYSFVRLSTGTSLQPHHIIEHIPLLIYDKQIFKELDYEERFNTILEQEPKKIFFLHTPNMIKKEHLDCFISLNIIQEESFHLRTTPIIINLTLNVSNFRSFINQYQNYFRSFTKKTILFPTYSLKDYSLRTPINKLFEKVANLIYYSYNQGIAVGISEIWIPDEEARIIMNTFTTYINGGTTMENKTFSAYYFKTGNKKTKLILKKFYDNNPQLHYLFDVSLAYLLLGGTWYGQFRNSPTSKFS